MIIGEEGVVDRLTLEVGFEIEEEIREVESRVMAGVADMLLEETRSLRDCRHPSSVHWW